MKMAISCYKGLDIYLPTIKNISTEQFLFSETQSRILVSVKKNNVTKFKKLFKKSSISKIAECNNTNIINFIDKNKIYSEKILNFEKSYKQKIRGL